MGSTLKRGLLLLQPRPDQWRFAVQEKTAFITQWVLYIFKVMPSGLVNARVTFERLRDRMLLGIVWSECVGYILVFGTDFDAKVLDRLGKACLK